MDNSIYSASPLWIFAGTLAGLAFLIVIGVVGLIFAVFRRKEKKITRIFMAFLGLFLCTMGALGLGFTALSMMTGAKTATVLLNEKTVARDNCGDGSTCTRYLLETTSGPKSIDFTVEQRAYDAVEQGNCYEMTYYPSQGLFARVSESDLYEAIPYVTGIKQVGSEACE